jgi:hypothetical protein
MSSIATYLAMISSVNNNLNKVKMKKIRKEYCKENGLNYIKPENSSMNDYILYLEKKTRRSY